ncbi:energy transducer TonB [Spirochaeta dissipatitropha]
MSKKTGPARVAAIAAAVLLHIAVLFMLPGTGSAGNSESPASSDFPLTAALSIRIPQPTPSHTAVREIPELDPTDMEAPIEIDEEPEELEEPDPENEPDPEPEPEIEPEIALKPDQDQDQTQDPSNTESGDRFTSEGSAAAVHSATGDSNGAGGSRGTVFLPIYQVDSRPEIIQRADLVYPEAARRQNREGSVVIELDLTQSGSIESHRFIRSAGHGFDEAALAMLMQSSFSPAYVGQRAVAVRARFTINFRLQD